MDTAIAKMTKVGVKPIADITIEVFVNMLLESGPVTINGEEKSKENLMQMYEDFSKSSFANVSKQATKSAKASAKPRQSKVSGYMLFCAHHRPALKEKGLKFGEINSQLGEMWSQADKAPWNEQAENKAKESENIDKKD